MKTWLRPGRRPRSEAGRTRRALRQANAQLADEVSRLQTADGIGKPPARRSATCERGETAAHDAAVALALPIDHAPAAGRTTSSRIIVGCAQQAAVLQPVAGPTSVRPSTAAVDSVGSPSARRTITRGFHTWLAAFSATGSFARRTRSSSPPAACTSTICSTSRCSPAPRTSRTSARRVAHGTHHRRSTRRRRAAMPGVVGVYTAADLGLEPVPVAVQPDGRPQRCWPSTRCATSASRSPSSSPRPRQQGEDAAEQVDRRLRRRCRRWSTSRRR